MAGAAHPFDAVVVDGVDVSKGDMRTFIKTRAALLIADAAELQSFDLAGQEFVYFAATGRMYELDTGDATTDDDGVTCIRDANGLAFKLISINSPNYDLAAFVGGSPLGATELLFSHVFLVDVAFPLNFLASRAISREAATGSPILSMQKNAVEFGTVTFTGSVGAYSSPAISFAAGDILDVYGPASPDATLAQIAMTMRAARDE